LFYETDLNLQQSFSVGGRRRVEVSVNVLNLFNQDIAVNRFAAMTRDNVSITNQEFFAGFDMEGVLAERPAVRLDPRFLQDNAYQAPRTIRLGLKFTF
jgi:hypothetical protein